MLPSAEHGYHLLRCGVEERGGTDRQKEIEWEGNMMEYMVIIGIMEVGK